MYSSGRSAQFTSGVHDARENIRSHAPVRLAEAAGYQGNQAALRRLSCVTPRLQRKLEIGAVNDPLEAEADRVADQVMRMPDAVAFSADGAGSGSGTVRRKCAACEEAGQDLRGGSTDMAGTLNRKGAGCDEEEKSIQRKSDGQARMNVEAPAIVHEALNSQGQPLDPATRTFFEPRFGADFSGVRVHSDALAFQSAGAVNALAYTVGGHIVFGAGAARGKSGLLAHELAHTVQQGAAGKLNGVQRSFATPAMANKDGSASYPHTDPPLLRRQPQPPTEAPAPVEGVSPLVQKFIRGEATDAEKATLKQQLASGQLSATDFDALKASMDDQFRAGIQKALPPFLGAGQTADSQAGGGTGGGISFQFGGPSASAAGVHKFFKVGLRVRLSGVALAAAAGLEGTVETTAEVNAGEDAKTGTVSLAPPQGDTALAANIRARAFPNGAIVVPIGAGVIQALKIASVQGTLTVTITGKGGSPAGGLVLMSDDIPAGVELDLSVSESSGPPAVSPASGASALPPPRAFATAGGGSAGGQPVGSSTLGVDVPLITDTANPLIYGGIGLRATADTKGSLTGAGALIVGAHLSPITLQLALEAGAGRSGTDGKTTAAYGAEGSVSYKILQHVEVMALVSVIGGKEPATTIQAGLGVTF